MNNIFHLTSHVLPLLTLPMPLLAQEGAAEKERPNVIVVMTDDQGIGGLSCHSNPYLKTPCLDKFYEESVRLTDFHVSPFSTPTRAAIITGRYPVRNGAWATYKGRDIISGNDLTIADVFQQAGYATALFGKWHLGDNYPSRPTDSGFDYAVHHRAGGVSELSDYWGNSYFDDTYIVNNEPKAFKGYCTDIWFGEAISYIRRQQETDKPFFIYLATNAAHDPHLVDSRYSKPFQPLEDSKKLRSAGFYGQIVNMDENFGRLEAFLSESGLKENTILVFLTDNGAGAPNSCWTDGYRGAKGNNYEAGHRVPFFIRWIKGGLHGGKDIDGLTAHVDLLPTLSSLCGIKRTDTETLDGIDFSPLLYSRAGKEVEERNLFIHFRQDSKQPHDVKNSCVMHKNWRLINGNELYDLDKDKAQANNVADAHPEIVQSLLAANSAFMAETKLSPEYKEFVPVALGAEAQQTATLTIQHAMGDDPGLWKSAQVAEGMKNRNNAYVVDVVSAGTYRISLARWARECPGSIHGVPTTNPKGQFVYKAIRPEKARIVVGEKVYTKDITPDMTEVAFDVQMPQGTCVLKTDFVEGGEAYGVYYTYIEKIKNQ